MKSIELEPQATEQNFDEDAYLLANPDVVKAVKMGSLKSGKQHFESFGKYEARKLFLPTHIIKELKERKLQRIKNILRDDLKYSTQPGFYDFLTQDLREKYNIVETTQVTNHGYDQHVMDLISEISDGLVLDCGAGKRPVYYENIVNYEIVDYQTTDVRGIGEILPFIDDAFEAVISMSVLEHVKDPFLCAKEISRVLKPGGRLICAVPFLQPLHGYPDHYYNMTGLGLENLFSDYLQIDEISVYESVAPIWSLTWILTSWADGLHGETREQFSKMKIADFLNGATEHLNKPYVKELSERKNFELACATVLFAHK